MKRSLVLLPFLLLAGLAHAQQESFDAHVADIGLLQAKQIQTDVGITEAERSKMNVAAEAHKARLVEYEKQLKALGQTNPDPAKVRGLVEMLKKQVLAVITPAQTRRVRELTIQRLGLILVVNDPIVAKRVGLSNAQLDRMKAAFQSGRTKFQALQQVAQRDAAPIVAQYKGRQPKTQAEAQALQKEVSAKINPIRAKYLPQFQAIGKQTDAAMLGVLTPAQKTTWNALKGKPFVAK